jgi:thiol:disulfide interchange protein DsbC
MHALFPLLAAAALTRPERRRPGSHHPQRRWPSAFRSSRSTKCAHRHAGLYEVRVGTDLFYTDAKGNYLIQGELIDTKPRAT